MSQVSFKDFDLSVVFGFTSEKHLNVKTNIFFLLSPAFKAICCFSKTNVQL